MIRRTRNRRRPHLSKRYLEIIGILSKYGFSELARGWQLIERFKLAKRIVPERIRRELIGKSRWEKIRLMLAELGPTYIKLGQLLSNRQDILPRPLVTELEKLQDEAPPFPATVAVRIIEQELQQPLGRLYKDFITQPLAAASIAQVHKATLYSGEEVAVKVKRPGIDEKIKLDLAIMYRLASFVDKQVFMNDTIRTVDIIHEFEIKITQELSFKKELLNIRKFSAYFEQDPVIVVPKVYKEYSADSVLTLQFIEGIKVSKLFPGKHPLHPGYDPVLIARRTARFVATQILIHGFFHADPHPGNFLILKRNIICFIDYGIMSSLSPEQQYHLNSIILGMVLRNIDFLARAVLKLTGIEDPSKINNALFRSRLFDYMEKYLDLPLEELNLAEAFLSLLELIRFFKLKIPANLTYMVKALVTLESIGSQLDPEFNLFKILTEFIPQILIHQANLKNIRDASYLTLMDYSELVQEVPETVRAVHRFFKDRQLQLTLTGQAHFREALDKISFRLVNALILAALLVSSALIVNANIPPKWNGIPLIGVTGFVIGGVMGLIFLIDGLIKFFRWKYKD